MSIKEELIGKGYVFKSETDTEVVAHLLADLYDGDFLRAQSARLLSRISGSYSLVMLCADEPDKIICTKQDNPCYWSLERREFYSF